MKTFVSANGVRCAEVSGWRGEVHTDKDPRPCEACAIPAPGTRARFVLRCVAWGYGWLDWAARRWLSYPETVNTVFDSHILPEDAAARLKRWEGR